MSRFKIRLKQTVCFCLLSALLTASAQAQAGWGDNIDFRDNEISYPLDMKNCTAYTARVMRWAPAEINAEDFGISAAMTEYPDSYGGHAYIWNDGASELFVSDYGYMGYHSPNGATLVEIMEWFGGISALNLDSFDFNFARREEARMMASAFLKQLGISNAECVDIRCMDAQSANALMNDMVKDGYEKSDVVVNDTYILTYALKIDELYCDTEFFTLANQQDIEGCAITLMADQDGVQALSCSGPIYTAESEYRPEQTEILSFDEIQKIVSDKFNNLILSDPLEICDVKLQYVLLPVSDTAMAYIPCWCFATPRGTSGRYLWYRFNAYTGEEII